MNRPQEKQENVFVSLLLNIAIPSLILMKFSKPEDLGPTKGLIVALAFPILYGLYDFYDRKKFNFVSLLGFISILLTGGIGLLELSAHWMAVKEAAIPALIGIAVMGSLKTKYPLVRTIFFNDKLIDVNKVNHALESKNNVKNFDQLLTKTSLLLSLSFFLSSILNYGLAKWILVSEPGTPAFNEELGRMTALSYPVIVLPSMVVMMIALWVLMRGIIKLTGLTLEDVFHPPEKKAKT